MGQKSQAPVLSEYQHIFTGMNASSGERTDAWGSLSARIFMLLWCFPKPLFRTIKGGSIGYLSQYKYLDINIWGWGERRQAEHNTEEESLLPPNLRMARCAWDEVSKQLSLNGSG